MKVDLDVRREKQGRSDVVSGADELVESPAKDDLGFGLVDRLELSRSHITSHLS